MILHYIILVDKHDSLQTKHSRAPQHFRDPQVRISTPYTVHMLGLWLLLIMYRKWYEGMLLVNRFELQLPSKVKSRPPAFVMTKTETIKWCCPVNIYLQEDVKLYLQQRVKLIIFTNTGKLQVQGKMPGQKQKTKMVAQWAIFSSSGPYRSVRLSSSVCLFSFSPKTLLLTQFSTDFDSVWFVW